MKKRTLLAALSISLVVSSCGAGSSTPAVGGAPTSLAASIPAANPAVQELAEGICRAAVWTGIARGTSFQGELDASPIPQATEAELAEAVEDGCPNAFYEPLKTVELDWCGSGEVLSRNFFKVVESGVELKLPSFSVVDLPLLRKASRIRADLSDYEIELFTVEIVSMAATSGFLRDWAAACRATL